MRYQLLSSIAMVIFCLASSSYANEMVDSYMARLSAQDHFNSKGARLKSAAAIIRQDRANYHKFNLRDPEDTYDSVFGEVSNRAALERMLNKGHTTPEAQQAILNETPLIRVNIYKYYVDVLVVTDELTKK
jgi:hypothetical protein